jgi:hypothetical protein
MKFRRLPIISVALLSACAALELPASAQTTASLDAVATAGKQRMLSMRTLKAYAEIAVGASPDQARQILAASLSELRSANAQLLAIEVAGSDADLRVQSALIAKLSAVVAAPSSAGSMTQATQVAEDLLGNAEAVTQEFVKAGGDAPVQMVNLAARERMLSQRAAAMYLVCQTDAKSPEMKARALAAAKQFKAALTVFDDAKAEFPQIADQIELARMQTVFLDNALTNIDAPRHEQFATVATTSERVLATMDSMTHEIAKALVAQRSTVASVAKAKR